MVCCRVYAARMAEYDLEFKDFSLPEQDMKPKRFRVAPEDYSAPPVLPVSTIANLGAVAKRLTSLADGGEDTLAHLPEILNSVGDLFVELLDEESGPRFKARIVDPVVSKQMPLDLFRQILPIMFWLLEVYGLRPTEASSSSPNGQDDAGPGSTDGAPNVESPL